MKKEEEEAFFSQLYQNITDTYSHIWEKSNSCEHNIHQITKKNQKIDMRHHIEIRKRRE